MAHESESPRRSPSRSWDHSQVGRGSSAHKRPRHIETPDSLAPAAWRCQESCSRKHPAGKHKRAAPPRRLLEPKSSTATSRILNFWTLPLTVIGNPPTNFQCRGILLGYHVATSAGRI